MRSMSDIDVVLRDMEFNCVRSDSGCLIWIGAKSAAGYGQLRIDGRVEFVHRISYMLHNAVDIDGLVICHSCDMPSCVDPHHLFAGSQKDNMSDCSTKGRTSRQVGSASGKSRLSEADARLIYLSKVTAGVSAKALSLVFGIDQSVVVRISNGKAWPHVHKELSEVCHAC